jgi:hypothetical protein
MSTATLDFSFLDWDHFVIYPKPPLRPESSQDVKFGIIVSGLESALWHDFLGILEREFENDFDPLESKLCVYFHDGPR